MAQLNSEQPLILQWQESLEIIQYTNLVLRKSLLLLSMLKTVGLPSIFFVETDTLLNDSLLNRKFKIIAFI